MENRSFALKLVSEALHLDSSGFFQAAFEKYLHSLQVLSSYLNDLFASLGFQDILNKSREVKRVLCMIHECSDRVNAILEKSGQPTIPTQSYRAKSKSNNSSVEIVSPIRYPGFEKIQNENRTLLKSYHWRFERANDNVARSNLKLELKRRLAENDILAKQKFDTAVKQLQKERAKLMEKEMKKLFECHEVLDEKEREKRDLYASVLQYAKTETWPCTWKLNSWEDSDSEVVKKVFQRTIRSCDHPLSQWITMMQTNIKRELDVTKKQYDAYYKILPAISLDKEESPICMEKETCSEYIFSLSSTTEKVIISKTNLSKLEQELNSISSEIIYMINNVVHIFYLTYKSLLPFDCEEICLNLIESYILKPIWPNLINLYRIINIISEYKTLEAMLTYKESSPSEFGYSNQISFNPQIIEQNISCLRSLLDTESLTEKSNILVEILQSLCKSPNSQENILGADELMPLLCYIIVKTKLPQLSSECFAIEQLFDMKFMFGEEGYALSSFLTALKYIEMKKLIDGENNEGKETLP